MSSNLPGPSSKKAGGFLEVNDSRENPARIFDESIEENIITYPLETNPRCSHCHSIEIDPFLQQRFNVKVCFQCRESFNEGYYKLVTKSTALKEFLLTQEELNDANLLPWTSKPNPYKSTWKDMRLYLLGMVREYAIKKWGSLDALAAEQQQRLKHEESRKREKFRHKLSNLRRKTFIKSKLEPEINKGTHRHQFKSETQANNMRQVCEICGLAVDVEQFG